MVYEQKFGCAMGNPLAPVLANIVMDDLIRKQIHTISPPPPFFFKYVDDCITSLDPSMVKNVLDKLNEYHHKLQFTYELEEDGKLNFLDLTVIKSNDFNHYITNWYKKPTSSGRIINYHSTHPFYYKKNTATGLIHRVLELSHPSFHTQNINIIYELLRSNDYLYHLIKHLINNKLGINQPSINIHITPANTNRFCSLVYVPQLSENLGNLFKRVLPNVKIAHKVYKPLRQIFTKLKDTVEKVDQSNLVYSIPCNNCNCTYIGHTGRNLRVRLKEHANDSDKVKTNTTLNDLQVPTLDSPIRMSSPFNNIDKQFIATKSPTEKKNTSALIIHAKTTKHTFNFGDTKIVQKENVYHKRIVMEACEIICDDNVCNLRSDVAGVNAAYADILDVHKQLRRQKTIPRPPL